MSVAASFAIVDAGADAARDRFQIWRLCPSSATACGCALELWCCCARLDAGPACELVRCLPDQAAAQRHLSAREENERQEALERASRGAVPAEPGVWVGAVHPLPDNLAPQDVPF